MTRPPPRSTQAETLFPYTTLFRSGCENSLRRATIIDAPVVKDGNIITAKGPGMVFEFGLAIVTELLGQEKADEVAAGMLFY
jgi:4-methyl-5(b-hydroxyethyl)-thiazole monophosphate biosynthesis